jgi:hypothetical protein
MTFLIVFVDRFHRQRRERQAATRNAVNCRGTMKYRSKMIALLMAMVFVTTGISVGVQFL